MADPMHLGFATKGQAEGRAEDNAEVAVVTPIVRSGRLISMVKDLPKNKLPVKVMAKDVEPGTELDLEEGGTDSPVRPQRLETMLRRLLTGYSRNKIKRKT